MDDTHGRHDSTDDRGRPTGFTPAAHRSTAARAVAAAVVVAMAVGGLSLASRAGRSDDAGASLTAAQAAFTDDASYRFTFRTTEELSAGDPVGAGTETVTRTLTTGEVAAADRWWTSTEKGAGWTEESIRLGDTLYRRNLDAHDVSNEDRWVVATATDLEELQVDDLAYELSWLDGDDDGGGDLTEADRAWRASMRSSARLGIVATGHALDAAVDPARLTRLVRAAADAELVEQRSDGRTLRASVAPPAALAEAVKDPLPEAEVEIDLDADDRPVAVRVDLAENGAVLRVDLRFSDWGAPITVQAPDGELIDHTPSVDEEALRAADPDLLVAPADVPADLVLRSAKVTPGVGDCSIVTLEYWPSGADDLSQAELDQSLTEGDYLWLNTRLQRCSDTLGIGNDEAFSDELGGHPARRDWGWEVAFGSSVVSLDSNVDTAVLDTVAASLRPVTADELINAVAH